jgi:hypothetical protein
MSNPDDSDDQQLAMGGPESTAVVQYDPHDDGFAAAAADGDRKLLKGDLLKCIDGVWTRAGNAAVAGTQYVPVRLTSCWVKWQDNRPVDYKFARPNGVLPHRDTLDDNDQRNWPAGVDGQPADPWRNTRFFHLIDCKTAETVTYSNSTMGARLEYESLGRAVATMRRAHPKALPVVELSSLPMKTKRGVKQRPCFKIVDWRGLNGANGAVKQIEHDPMNDDIPF